MKRSRQIYRFVIAVCLLFTVTSCAKKVSFLSSTVVPAAKGNVTIKKDNNNNYAIRVKVENLTSPNRLRPRRDVYVVWMETENNGTKNLGQLKSSGGLFSSTLKGTLNTVSPFKPTRIAVTAEDNANIQHPGLDVVLRTREF